jgi:hypothetical protein
MSVYKCKVGTPIYQAATKSPLLLAPDPDSLIVSVSVSSSPNQNQKERRRNKSYWLGG